MQHYEIQKLRKRLKNHGYTNIHISHIVKYDFDFIYLSCKEPIFGLLLSGYIPFSNIHKVSR